jgi:hypothetical protein
MVMELLEGNNLEEELQRRGTLPVPEAVLYVLEAVEALAEAHAAGIVHRDLKPANLFVARRADRSRLLKVLDFGISKSMVDSHVPGDMSLTRTGVIIGSPLYMSPEQMRSTKDADTLSDIWALGAILFQLITGRPPYEGESIPELCAKLFSEDAPPPSTIRAGLPGTLDAVLYRALARDPSRRYQSVAELGAALIEYAPAGRIHVERARRVLQAKDGNRPSSTAPGPIQSESPTIQASVAAVALWSQLSGRERKRRWGLLLAAVAALAVLGVALVRPRFGSSALAEKGGVAAAALEPVQQRAAAAPEPVPAPPPTPATTVDAVVTPPSEPSVAASAASPSAAPRPKAPVNGGRPHGPLPAKSDTSSTMDFGGRR